MAEENKIIKIEFRNTYDPNNPPLHGPEGIETTKMNPWFILFLMGISSIIFLLIVLLTLLAR